MVATLLRVLPVPATSLVVAPLARSVAAPKRILVLRRRRWWRCGPEGLQLWSHAVALLQQDKVTGEWSGRTSLLGQWWQALRCTMRQMNAAYASATRVVETNHPPERKADK